LVQLHDVGYTANIGIANSGLDIGAISSGNSAVLQFGA
jgi:hypothetical protein